jgi:putative SOS response-associated peptidase YedK
MMQYVSAMCGRIIQPSGPLHYKFVDGLDVPDRRLSNTPRRYNGAPSEELLVIRQNQETVERSLDLLKWGLISVLEQGSQVPAEANQCHGRFPSELMKMWPISKRVNSPQNDDEGLLTEIDLSAVS